MISLGNSAQLFEGQLALNLGLNSTLVSFSCAQIKALSWIIFSDIFRASNHQPVDKRIKTEMLFKLSNLNSNLALTLGYLNPALNSLAQGVNSGFQAMGMIEELFLGLKFSIPGILGGGKIWQVFWGAA